MVLPIYEEDQPGEYYNTAAVIDADGALLGNYRKHHMPNLDNSGRSSISDQATSGYPVFETAVGPVGCLYLLRPTLPGGLA